MPYTDDEKLDDIANKLAAELGKALGNAAQGSAPDMIYELAADAAIDVFGTICKGFGAKIHQCVFIIVAPGDNIDPERVRLFIQANPKERTGTARAVSLAAGDLNTEMKTHARHLIKEALENDRIRDPAVDDDEVPDDFQG